MSPQKDVTMQPMGTDETGNDLRTNMEGERYMEGGRHDMTSRGITSSTLEDAFVDEPSPAPYVDQTMYQPSQEQGDGQTWQQRYGQSENEKGAWRRAANEALEELNSLKGELAAIRAQPPSYPQSPPSSAPTHAQPDRYFAGKADDDLVQFADLENMLKGMVAPAMMTIASQNQALAATQYALMKSQAGITPAIERTLLGRHTWLQSLPDGVSKVQAMQTLLPNGNEPPARTQPSVANSAQAAARRVTYVEPGRPNTPAQEQTREQLFEHDMADAILKPWGAERKNAMEAVFTKYGIEHRNDFRDGQIRTR